MFTIRNSLFIFLCVMAGMSLPCQQPAAMAAKISYASEIVKDVREDKVYLLEKIRKQLTKPSEKILVEALLTEDGPKAAKLYRKQLEEHPDPQLDPISSSRLAAYEFAVSTTPGLPVMQARASSESRPALMTIAQPLQPKQPVSKPDSSLKRTPPPAGPAHAASKGDTVSTRLAPPPAQASGGGFTLQFGSFDSITNAEQMVAQLQYTAPARVQQINGVYKVRLRRTFTTQQEAAAFARTLPIESIVVPPQP
ncbi:SPOR domain-containing protein [Chlorobaculum tepidum]|nr:SPOR domain-containing protein [Chlorobaculum tepidum]